MVCWGWKHSDNKTDPGVICCQVTNIIETSQGLLGNCPFCCIYGLIILYHTLVYLFIYSNTTTTTTTTTSRFEREMFPRDNSCQGGFLYRGDKWQSEDWPCSCLNYEYLMLKHSQFTVWTDHRLDGHFHTGITLYWAPGTRSRLDRNLQSQPAHSQPEKNCRQKSWQVCLSRSSSGASGSSSALPTLVAFLVSYLPRTTWLSQWNNKTKHKLGVVQLQE